MPIIWGRWLLILPAAIGGYAVFQLLVIAGNFWVPEDSLANLIWVRLVAGSIAPAVGFVLAGSRIAPDYKVKVALALAIIYAAFMGGIAALTLVTPQERLSDPKLFTLIGSALGLVAVAGAYYIVRRQERQKELFTAGARDLELDAWGWYLLPGWRSFFTWPLVLYYLGGVLFAFAWWLALEIDLARWNLIIWLFFGWHAPTMLTLGAPMGAYLLGFHWTASTWLSPRFRQWWGLPIKLLLTGLAMVGSNVGFGLIVAGISNLLDAAVKIDLSTTKSVLELFSQFGIWIRIGG